MQKHMRRIELSAILVVECKDRMVEFNTFLSKLMRKYRCTILAHVLSLEAKAIAGPRNVLQNIKLLGICTEFFVE